MSFTLSNTLTKRNARKIEKQANDLFKAVVPHVKAANDDIKGFYPRASRQVGTLLHDTYDQSKKFFESPEFNNAILSVSRNAKDIGSFSAKLLMGYGFYKLITARQTAEVTGKVKNYVNEKPVESAFLALAGGFLLSRIVR